MKRRVEGRGCGEVMARQGKTILREVRAAPTLSTASDAVPPVKTHICLSNFYQLNGYSPESPIGGT